MIGKAIGLALYSLSLGLWVIGFVWLTVASAPISCVVLQCHCFKVAINELNKS